MDFSDFLWLGWALLVPVLSTVLFFMFRSDIDRLKSRKPITFLFMREIRHGEPLYNLAAIEVMAPYIGVVAIALFMALVMLGTSPV